MIGGFALEKKTIIEKKRNQEERDEKQTDTRSNTRYKIRPSLLGLQAYLGISKILKRHYYQYKTNKHPYEKA